MIYRTWVLGQVLGKGPLMLENRIGCESYENSGRVEEMADLVAAAERLRPLLNNRAWDYCVIWKLGNDPSRFIEWGACCCSGGNGGASAETVNGESGGEKSRILLCRDSRVSHLARTVACRGLANLPSYLPLYSGIHGDIVISKQPEWLVYGSASGSENEQIGTRVLVPISCGLIELCSENHIPRNQKIIDFIGLQFRLSDRQDEASDQVYTDLKLIERLGSSTSNSYVANWLPPFQGSSSFVVPVSQTRLEGSSTGSCLSSELQYLETSSNNVLGTMKRKRTSHADVKNLSGFETKASKTRQKAQNGPYRSKNLLTERKRRKREKDGIFALRSLVPNISKMDRLATLGDAAKYIEELTETIVRYNDELRAMEVEHTGKTNAEEEENTSVLSQTDVVSAANSKKPAEAQVEMSQLGPKDFFLKVVCKHRRGGFSRLMEAIDSLGLNVTDANTTSFRGSVSNVLKVEANQMGIELNTLKRSLIQLLK